MLIKNFKLDSTLIKVLTLTRGVYKVVIEEAPDHFGETIDSIDYRYDVLLLIGISSRDAMKEVDVRLRIDTSWQGTHAIYYRRPGPTHSDYTKSALSRLAKKRFISPLPSETGKQH